VTDSGAIDHSTAIFASNWRARQVVGQNARKRSFAITRGMDLRRRKVQICRNPRHFLAFSKQWILMQLQSTQTR
jgi:hypothetical protein